MKSALLIGLNELWTRVSSRSMTRHFLCISSALSSGSKAFSSLEYGRACGGQGSPSEDLRFPYPFPKQHNNEWNNLFFLFCPFSLATWLLFSGISGVLDGCFTGSELAGNPGSGSSFSFLTLIYKKWKLRMRSVGRHYPLIRFCKAVLSNAFNGYIHASRENKCLLDGCECWKGITQ